MQLVFDIKMHESKVGVASGDFGGAPGNGGGNDVNTKIAGGRCQVLCEGDGSLANAAANFDHMMLWLEAGEGFEVSDLVVREYFKHVRPTAGEMHEALRELVAPEVEVPRKALLLGPAKGTCDFLDEFVEIHLFAATQ
jgi:hypothetical protein